MTDVSYFGTRLQFAASVVTVFGDAVTPFGDLTVNPVPKTIENGERVEPTQPRDPRDPF